MSPQQEAFGYKYKKNSFKLVLICALYKIDHMTGEKYLNNQLKTGTVCQPVESSDERYTHI